MGRQGKDFWQGLTHGTQGALGALMRHKMLDRLAAKKAAAAKEAGLADKLGGEADGSRGGLLGLDLRDRIFNPLRDIFGLG